MSQTSALEQAVAAARQKYQQANPKSAEVLETASRYMPGGNTRSVLFYDPFPLVIARGEGSRLWDVDGHEYLDALGEFTAGLFGHSHPVIRKAIEDALANGINFGGHNQLEVKLAAAICERFHSIDRVRFTNSGTEANLMAIALAKAHTGRQKIIVFEGGYHGSVLGFTGSPLPTNVPHDFLVLPYNDSDRLRAVLAEEGDSVAAILVEPMLGAGGCVPAEPEFLHNIRHLSRQRGALMILDEVMTSRMSASGIQGLLDLQPDLTTLGKYIGGGMSFGAFGGRQDIMALFDPQRPGSLPHAGTFNNNVMTMAAGLAGYTQIFTPEESERLRARGDEVRARLNHICQAQGVAIQFTGIGSVFNIQFAAGPLKNFADVAHQDNRAKELFFFDMVAAGIYIARRGLFALNLMMEPADLERLVSAVEGFVAKHRDLFI